MSSKQGAYGKVPIHKHSKCEQLSHIDEVLAIAKYLVEERFKPTRDIGTEDENFRFCDSILGKVSRSFSAVIRQLPPGLCHEILVFYLTLRALDTVEDDMEAYLGRQEEKL